MQLNIFFPDTHPSIGVGNTVLTESEETVLHLLPNYADARNTRNACRFCPSEERIIRRTNPTSDKGIWKDEYITLFWAGSLLAPNPFLCGFSISPSPSLSKASNHCYHFPCLQMDKQRLLLLRNPLQSAGSLHLPTPPPRPTPLPLHCAQCPGDRWLLVSLILDTAPVRPSGL